MDTTNSALYGWALCMSAVIALLPASAAPTETSATTASGTNAEVESTVCIRTAHLAIDACPLAARSDYLLGLGRCANLADLTARQHCTAAAQEELASAQDDCAAQFAARRDACSALGETAYRVTIDPHDFLDKAGILAQPNPMLPLVPGRTCVYRNGDEYIRTTVTHRTRQILGVTVIVVHDISRVNGVTSEDTEDWFAQDTQGNVWYFGELSRQYEQGRLASLEGSWEAGVDGAQPGIVMPALPRVGDVYRQEFALGDAEDMAKVVNLHGSATTPAASCDGTCLVTHDFSPLEPDVSEYKYYAPGVGLILTLDRVEHAREELIDIETR